MRLFYICSCLAIFLLVSGCGRVSKPRLPDDSFYPHTYIVKEKVVLQDETGTKGEVK